MKIHEYNQMMAYLTRPATPTETPDIRQPAASGGVIGQGGMFQGEDLGDRMGFSNYTKKLVTPKFLKASGTSLENLTLLQKKLFNEGELFYAKVKGKGGQKATNVFGNSEKINTILGTSIPTNLSNLPDEVANAGVTGQKIRQKFIKEYLETLSKGEAINLDATARIIDKKLIEATNGKITMKDKNPLLTFLDNPKLNTNKIRKPKNLKEAAAVEFKNYPSIDKFETVQKQANDLNTKYKLNDKGVRFIANQTSGDRVGMRLSFTGAPYRDANEAVKNLDRAPTPNGISELVDELKKILNTETFKNYSAKEASRAGSVKAGSKKLKYNQLELFDYLLNQKGPVSKQQVIKDFKKLGYDEGILRKAIGNLHANMYRALDPASQGGQFLSSYDNNQIKNVLDKVKNNFPGDFFNRTFENLLVDAYGDVPKKYKPLADKLKKFRELQKELRKAGVADEFIAQLDHVIPFNFLQKIREGANPEELLRVKAYPGTLNSMTFKGNIDSALIRATEAGNKELTKIITELRDFLPEDMGKLDSTGRKIIDYGAKPFNLKTKYSDQQKKFGQVYDRAFKFLENPKVIKLLENAGIGFKAIRDIKRLNAPGFLKTFENVLKKNPELRVQLEEQFGNEYTDIENQYAALDTGTMSDVSPTQKKFDEGLPAETLPALAAGAYKIGKPIAKGLLKTAISPVAGIGFAGSELLSEDPNLTLAGTELIGYGELAKKANLTSKLLNPKGVGRFLGAPGAIMAGTDIVRRVAQDSEPNMLIDKETGEPKSFNREDASFVMPTILDASEKASRYAQENNISYEEAFKLLYGDKTFKEGLDETIDNYNIKDVIEEYNNGGRVGYADGPKDPKRRTVIKGLTALAALPVIGKYFKLAPKAGKIATVAMEKISGMPNWFQPFVNKVLKMGDDVTDTAATTEREIVKRMDIEDATVDVHYNTATNDVRVEVVGGKNAFDEPLEMQYKAPEVIEETGKKTKGEFSAAESRPVQTSPDDIELDGYDTDVLDDLLSETDYLEGFATGKIRTPAEIKKAKLRAKMREDAQRDPGSLLDDFDD